MTAMIANISFQRNLTVNYTNQLTLDWKKSSYLIVLNWGVFKHENDTSQNYIFGARNGNPADILNFTMLQPKQAKQIFISFIVSLFSVSFIMIL